MAVAFGSVGFQKKAIVNGTNIVINAIVLKILSFIMMYHLFYLISNSMDLVNPSPSTTK